MPTYVYKCPTCNKEEEVNHAMSSIGRESELPQCILHKISCTLKCGRGVIGEIWERVPQKTQVMGMYGGSSYHGEEKGRVIRKERQKRSSQHFHGEIKPTLPKEDQNYFDKSK